MLRRTARTPIRIDARSRRRLLISYRCKIQPASYHALSALPWLLPGTTIPDGVVILGSLDPIMGEADR